MLLGVLAIKSMWQCWKDTSGEERSYIFTCLNVATTQPTQNNFVRDVLLSVTQYNPFREMKSIGLKFKDDIKIVFGSNVGWEKCLKIVSIELKHRGLIAAGIWAEVWPEHKKEVVVVSSIYEVSTKVNLYFSFNSSGYKLNKVDSNGTMQLKKPNTWLDEYPCLILNATAYWTAHLYTIERWKQFGLLTNRNFTWVQAANGTHQ